MFASRFLLHKNLCFLKASALLLPGFFGSLSVLKLRPSVFSSGSAYEDSASFCTEAICWAAFQAWLSQKPRQGYLQKESTDLIETFDQYKTGLRSSWRFLNEKMSARKALCLVWVHCKLRFQSSHVTQGFSKNLARKPCRKLFSPSETT